MKLEQNPLIKSRLMEGAILTKEFRVNKYICQISTDNLGNSPYILIFDTHTRGFPELTNK